MHDRIHILKFLFSNSMYIRTNATGERELINTISGFTITRSPVCSTNMVHASMHMPLQWLPVGMTVTISKPPVINIMSLITHLIGSLYFGPPNNNLYIIETADALITLLIYY